jgi:hypothetical protein
MATDDMIDMIWEPYWLGRPAGTHYSDGTSSALLFGDVANDLRTHAVRGPRIEEDDESEGSPDLLTWAVAIAAGVSLGIGVMKAAPKVKLWWNDLRSKRLRNAARGDVDRDAPAVALSAIPVEDFSKAVDLALEQHRTMSSAEAQRRILEILLAAAIIAKNMRALSRAHIEDGASLTLQTAMEKLTVPQLTDSLNRMLELDSSVLDDETSAMFMEIFGGGRRADGQYVPLQNEKVKRALRPSRSAA